jgi:hypothetical protein
MAGDARKANEKMNGQTFDPLSLLFRGPILSALYTAKTAVFYKLIFSYNICISFQDIPIEYVDDGKE